MKVAGSYAQCVECVNEVPDGIFSSLEYMEAFIQVEMP